MSYHFPKAERNFTSFTMQITYLTSLVRGCGNIFLFSTAQSMEGTASFLSHLLERNEDVFPRFRSARCSKYDKSKCTEQSTDVFDGCHFARCRWTKRIHFSPIASSRGNICREIPSGLEFNIGTTHMSGASCKAEFARRPFLWFLYTLVTLHAHSGFTLS